MSELLDDNILDNTVFDKDNDLVVWDNSQRARFLMIVFAILTGLTLVGIITGYMEIELLKSIDRGDYVEDSAIEASDTRQIIIGLLQTVLYIISVVVFLNWFRRAYGNLHRLKVKHLNHKESMAVWTWFIPIIVLFRPVQIMSEIWTETQHKLKKFDPEYSIQNGGILIGVWWMLFIISNFVGNYVLRTAFKDETIEQLIEASQAILISDILQIPEALLVILIVYQLSQMESRLAEEVRLSGGNVVYK